MQVYILVYQEPAFLGMFVILNLGTVDAEKELKSDNIHVSRLLTLHTDVAVHESRLAHCLE